MSKSDSYVVGFLTTNITMSKLSLLLAESGYPNDLGSWKIRLDTKMYFSFAYVGNLTPSEPYEIEGDGYNIPIEDVIKECERLATVLSANNLEYEFTHFDSSGEEISEYVSK